MKWSVFIRFAVCLILGTFTIAAFAEEPKEQGDYFWLRYEATTSGPTTQHQWIELLSRGKGHFIRKEWYQGFSEPKVHVYSDETDFWVRATEIVLAYGGQDAKKEDDQRGGLNDIIDDVNNHRGSTSNVSLVMVFGTQRAYHKRHNAGGSDAKFERESITSDLAGRKIKSLMDDYMFFCSQPNETDKDSTCRFLKKTDFNMVR